jgi:putative acetyltransferase
MTVGIRRATPADAAGYARVMSDPAVYPGLMQLPYNDEQQWRERLTEITGAGKVDLILVAERDGTIVGNAGLHPLSLAAQVRRRHVGSLGIAVAPEARGQGVGTALMQAMCDYADRWLGLLRIELTVYVDNARAIALYERFGFEIEGRFRGYAMRDGQLVDAFAMARIHPAPPWIDPGPSAARAPKA